MEERIGCEKTNNLGLRIHFAEIRLSARKPTLHKALQSAVVTSNTAAIEYLSHFLFFQIKPPFIQV